MLLYFSFPLSLIVILTSSMRHPIILRNSLIIILHYVMAHKSDEVRKYLFIWTFRWRVMTWNNKIGPLKWFSNGPIVRNVRLNLVFAELCEDAHGAFRVQERDVEWFCAFSWSFVNQTNSGSIGLSPSRRRLAEAGYWGCAPSEPRVWV